MKKRLLIPLAAAAVLALFVFVYSFLPLTTPSKYSSPDEMANAFFGKLWADQGAMWYYDQYTIPSGGIAHPRSMSTSADSFVVPGGFLGLPILYGSLGKLVGSAAIPYMTPVVAVLAALAWYGLTSRYLGRRAGVIAAVLLLVQPSWWYVTSRTMQPNVLFCAFVIFAAYFFFVTPLRALVERAGSQGQRLLRNADPFIAGICAAVAVAVRSSEAYWLVLVAVALLVMHRKQLPWLRMVLFGIGSALALMPFLIFNNTVHGSYIGTGYGAVSEVSANLATQGWGNRLLGPVRPYLFPLGFAPRTALMNAWTFGVTFFWWWTLAVVAAVAVFWRGRGKVAPELRASARSFGVMAAVIAVWLVAFYGSYLATDSPGGGASIGSSYFRYWLPISVLSTVPLAWWLSGLGANWPARRRKLTLLGSIVALTLASGASVFLSPGEGLLPMGRTVTAHTETAQRIFALTTGEDIIIVDYDDKYLFPERHVIVPLRSAATFKAVPKIDGLGNVYYFGITFPEKDFAHLRDVQLAPIGFELLVIETFGEQTLYQFKRKE